MIFFKWFLYLLALGGFIWFVFFRSVGDHNAIAKGPDTDATFATDSTSSEDFDGESEEIDYVTSEDNTNVVSENTDVVTDNASTDISSSGINLNNRFLIVVGSFGVKSNADRMLRRVKDSGKEGVITYINGLHRVVTASTDDEGDAKNLRSHFTHVYKEQAFILKQ